MDCIQTDEAHARTHAAFTMTRPKGVGGDGLMGTREGAGPTGGGRTVRLLFHLAAAVLSSRLPVVVVRGQSQCLSGHRWNHCLPLLSASCSPPSAFSRRGSSLCRGRPAGGRMCRQRQGPAVSWCQRPLGSRTTTYDVFLVSPRSNKLN